jgi:hypothetical protein
MTEEQQAAGIVVITLPHFTFNETCKDTYSIVDENDAPAVFDSRFTTS